MMKKLFLFAAFTFAAMPSVAQVNYIVSGTFAENGMTVYLLDQLTEKAIENRGRFSMIRFL